MNTNSTVIELEDLRGTIAELLELDPEEVTDDARFVQDLGVDSLLALEMQIVLEERYGVQLTETDLAEATSLRATYDLVTRKAAAVG
ncbi:acyl carrier protein [Streptomyces sp. AV19]|uniref:acyl carrier protein n=1 Tax=Streptomyces sp. AV19 TaxID=2793068 RepID=UPI0018FE4239|nr:acyl carrier protein [Streptomyces sp. AV19]MBH1934182.1 acyl carrier protein [Streptomyces sp. AV19]MDG4533555.1 acyl carrier protein [Streptomyces sp. AV19]